MHLADILESEYPSSPQKSLKGKPVAYILHEKNKEQTCFTLSDEMDFVRRVLEVLDPHSTTLLDLKFKQRLAIGEWIGILISSCFCLLLYHLVKFIVLYSLKFVYW